MGFWANTDVAVVTVTKQEVIDVTQKNEGVEYVIPRVVLTIKIESKIVNFGDPYNKSSQQALPSDVKNIDRIMINFWTDPELKNKNGDPLLGMTADAVEKLGLPMDFDLQDLKENADGSAPNINLVGRGFFAKAAVKEYNGKESIFWNLHRFTFGAKKPATPVSDESLKAFKRNAKGSLQEARKAVQAGWDTKCKEKGRVPMVGVVSPNGTTDQDVPF